MQDAESQNYQPAVARLIAAAHAAVEAGHKDEMTFDLLAELDFAASGLEVALDDIDDFPPR